MNGKTLGALAAVALLAACSSPLPDSAGRSSSAAGGSGGTATAAQDPLGSGADKVFFDYDQSVIRDDGRVTLDRQADWLNQNRTVNVLVSGDCDERGTEEYNFALGNRRAFAAATYLSAKGVAGTRISTVSYGKDKPIAPGSTEEAWSQNRNAITSVR
jgi:peptidoglycan-associated lipoprotein